MQSKACVHLIDKLEKEGTLTKEEFVILIERHTDQDARYLFQKADMIRKRYFGNKIFIRGLIEFTNYCKNDCYYCGIRNKNEKLIRYRMHYEEIMACCEAGYGLGFRTFVLQGGEDGYYTDERMVYLISSIRKQFPDCAITLSIGEKSRESYEAYYRAGADRYLLRQETADAKHYGMLHPPQMSLKRRMDCLRTLKEIGYQVGAGFMVGSPGQKAEHLAEDMLFLRDLTPHMVGIGPFLHHRNTPFWNWNQGSLERTLFMLGLLRVMLPDALLPSTTALATLHPEGRKKGIQAGANVVMPNLTPKESRKAYELYDNKSCTGLEAGESVDELNKQMKEMGYEVVVSRGDWTGYPI